MTAPDAESISALTTPGLLEPYKYQPLSTPNSIRVLCLEPAKAKEMPLCGSIIQYDRFTELAKVHSRRKYCAVSYVWGTPEFTEHLEITDPNRDGRSTILNITPSVKTMLQHFRKPDKKQYLWIDAICLNQSDQVEKANQIPLMGEIYAQAYKSKFWLGAEGGLKTAKIFAYFRCSASMPTPAVLEQNLPFPNHEEFASQVKRLLKRTWFTRRWILQEARLSQNATMWCGDHSIPYHVFVTACNNIVNGRYELENRLNDEYAVKSTHQINSLVRGNNGTEDMSTLLWNFHESACSEERDRFGALYGLIPRGLQPELDLTAPYPRLFQQFAVREVNRSSVSAHRLIIHLDSFGSLNCYEQFGTSTWVPDWSQQRRKRRINLCINTVLREAFPLSHELDSRLCGGETGAVPHMTSDHYWSTFGQCMKFMTLGQSSFTHLSAYYDTGANDCSTGSQHQETTAILRVRWLHPYVGTCGLTVASVVTAPKSSSRDTISVTFLQELQSLINKGGLLGPSRLCRFIQETMFSNGSKTHSNIERDLLAYFIELYDRTWSETSDTGQCDISNLYDGKLLHLIAKRLYYDSLAILECKNPDTLDPIIYALGPTGVKKDDCMIPLACNIQGQDRSADTAWVRHGRGHLLENMMAVRLCDLPGVPPLAVKTNINLKVSRAKFLGLCLAHFPVLKPGWRDQKARVEAQKVTRNVEFAKTYGTPMPYVFDIV